MSLSFFTNPPRCLCSPTSLSFCVFHSIPVHCLPSVVSFCCVFSAQRASPEAVLFHSSFHLSVFLLKGLIPHHLLSFLLPLVLFVIIFGWSHLSALFLSVCLSVCVTVCVCVCVRACVRACVCVPLSPSPSLSLSLSLSEIMFVCCSVSRISRHACYNRIAVTLPELPRQLPVYLSNRRTWYPYR